MLEEKEAEKDIKKAKKKEKGNAGRPHFQINRKKLFGGVLVVIMLAILVSVGYLLFQKAFRAEPIAKLLPADSTVAVLEINTNFEHNQLNKTFNLLKNHPEYSKEKLIEKAEKILILDYENDLQPWLGRQVGLALLNSGKEKGTVYDLYFAEFVSRTSLDKFLEKYRPVENTYSGKKTYQLNTAQGSIYLAFINNYLFFTSSEQAIFQLLDGQNGAIDKLYSSDQYRSVNSNLPLNRTAFLFLNFDQINDGFFQHFPFLSQSGLSGAVVEPFLKTFNAEGVTLVATEENFALQSFLSLDSEISENSEYLSFQKKYTAGLADYLSQETVAFWGGENLEYQFKKILEILSGGDRSALTLFDRLLENYTWKYFGKDTDFEADLLPLVKKEFAFAIEKNNGSNIYKVLFELESPQTDTIKIHDLASNFAALGAVFEPRVVEHKLEDGTVGKEIIAVPEEIIKNESNYGDVSINELKMGKQGWGIYYAVVDDVAIVTNDINSIKNTIDIAGGAKSGLGATATFTSNIRPVLDGSDEISYFNFEAILPLLFKQNVPDIFKIMDSFSSGRNYFNDGVETINYLHIK